MNTSQAKPAELSLIVAMSMTTRVIGNLEGELPWPKLKGDFAHFKKTTMGHPVIMGRVTWEEIEKRTKGKGLPGRTNIVVTNQRCYEVPGGILVAYSIDEAIAIANRAEKEKTGNKEIFVIGGAKIYEATIDKADRIYSTVVNVWLTEGPKFPMFPNWFRKVPPNKVFPATDTTPSFFIKRWERYSEEL